MYYVGWLYSESEVPCSMSLLVSSARITQQEDIAMNVSQDIITGIAPILFHASSKYRNYSVHIMDEIMYALISLYRCPCNGHSGTCNNNTGLDCDCKNDTKTVCPSLGNFDCRNYQVILC